MYEKNARDKLAEAKFFLSKMTTEQSNREIFNFYLSAFLSASRSILQYAREKMKNDESRLKWYDDYVSKNPPLRFFKDRRDINIHSSPVNPSLQVNVRVQEHSIRISESVRIVLKDRDGNVISDRTFGEHEPEDASASAKKDTVKVDYTYKFTEWNGAEDVSSFCQIYIKELEKFIEVCKQTI